MTTEYTNFKKKFLTRHNVYLGLLFFVVVAGCLLLLVPQVRHRLLDRAQTLKSAIAGDIKPISAQVGENVESFPEEFARATPPAPSEVKLPAAVFSMRPSGEISSQPIRRYKIPAGPRNGSAPPVLLRGKDAEESADISPMEPSESGPKYKQGKIEQEAYDLVLKSNKTLAGMVQGSDPSLHFKSWDVAFRGEDVYWVRVTFQSEGKPEVQYIWQVVLSLGEITPLSFNARSLL